MSLATSRDLASDRADPITRIVAARIRALRRAQGMSQADLEHALSNLRSGWTRSTIAKFEKHLRETISVADLLALALALDVPVVSLLVTGTAAVPVPGCGEIDAARTLKWITGRQPLTAAASFRWQEAVSELSRLESTWCSACDDTPPPGFTCKQCGRG